MLTGFSWREKSSVVRSAESGLSIPVGSQRQVFDLQPKDPRWEEFVANHPEALPYHHPAWSEVIRETFKYRPAALGCTNGAGQLSGILPLFEKRGLLTGLHLSSLPHTDERLAAPLSAAARQVEHSAVLWLQVKTLDPGLDRVVEGFSHVTWDATYVLELPNDPERLRFGNSRNHSRISWAVR
jgi:hypothetical protein